MIIRKVTIMMLALNAAVAFLGAAGAAEAYGIQQETGISDTVDQVQSSAETIGSGPVGLIEAVTGMAIAAISLVVDLLAIAFAGPVLFSNLGVPDFIVTFLFAPLYLVVAIDIVAILRGDSGI
jgi:hypothetical protein